MALKKSRQTTLQNGVITKYTGEMIQEVEKVRSEVIEDNMSNSNSDSFFKEEELSGENTLIQDLEIELEAEKLVKEAKYKFRVKNIGIDRDVITPYGLKNKLIIEYHIKAFIDDEEISYDLKQ